TPTTDASSQPRIVALRRRIWRRWRAYLWLTRLIFGWMALDFLVLLPLVFVLPYNPFPCWFVASATGWLAGLLILGVARGMFLLRAHKEIGALWASLTPEERAEAIGPFTHRARRLRIMPDLMPPFLRSAPRVSEVIPAPAPCG